MVFLVIIWVAGQSSHSYFLTIRRSGWIASTSLCGYFNHSVGMDELDKSKQSEANVVVTNTTATTSTVTSSHTTLGSVTSIGPHACFLLISGILTFVAYSMMKPFLKNISRAIETITWGYKGFHTFPSDINPKVIISVRLQFEIAYTAVTPIYICIYIYIYI